MKHIKLTDEQYKIIMGEIAQSISRHYENIAVYGIKEDSEFMLYFNKLIHTEQYILKQVYHCNQFLKN